MKPPEILRKSHYHPDRKKDDEPDIEEQLEEYDVEFTPSPALIAELRWLDRSTD